MLNRLFVVSPLKVEPGNAKQCPQPSRVCSARLWTSVERSGLKPSSWPLTIFLVITSFWILKPLKKSLFVGFYDQTGFDLLGWHMTAAQAELLAKVGNMLVALVAATAFAYLARSLRRQQLTYVFAGFSMVCYLVYSLLLTDPRGATVWTFYLYGDLFNTLMVPTFFAFLNDSVTTGQAKRLYGLVVLGGVFGGFVGANVVRVRLHEYSLSGWMWICLAIAFLIIVVSFLAARSFGSKSQGSTKPETQPSNQNPVTEGARLVFRSRYLLAIVSILGLYEMASTIMDFQFTSAMSHYLDGPAIGDHFATVFALTTLIGFLVQLFSDQSGHDPLRHRDRAAFPARGRVAQFCRFSLHADSPVWQRPEYLGQRAQLLDQPVFPGGPLRTHHPGKKNTRPKPLSTCSYSVSRKRWPLVSALSSPASLPDLPACDGSPSSR